MGVCLVATSVLASGGAMAAAPGARAATSVREPAAVVDLLIELLAGGTTPGRVVSALEALAKLGDPRSFEAVALYAGHRRTEVRLEAVRTLGTLDDARVNDLLLERLGDDVPEIRAAAAEIMATRHEARAVARLVLLAQRNDLGVAAPLGRLATPEAIAQLRERQGAITDAVLATVLGAYVKRTDVSDGARIDILRALGDLHGAESTAALREYLASVPAHENRPSKREAQRLVDDREGEK